jgi:uncharacterized cupin superfamily protein
MLLHAESTHTEGPVFDVWKYQSPSNQSAVIGGILTGRYPTQGWARNPKVEQYFLLIEGEAYVCTHEEGQCVRMIKGDIFYMPKGELYHCYPAPDCKEFKFLIFTTPSFASEQQEILSDEQVKDL